MIVCILIFIIFNFELYKGDLVKYIQIKVIKWDICYVFVLDFGCQIVKIRCENLINCFVVFNVDL